MFGKPSDKVGKQAKAAQRPFRAMDDLSLLSDREIATLLGEIEQADATIAILGMDEELRDRFFHAMPAADRDRIRKEWKAMKSVDPAKAAATRDRVLAIANRLSPSK